MLNKMDRNSPFPPFPSRPTTHSNLVTIMAQSLSLSLFMYIHIKGPPFLFKKEDPVVTRLPEGILTFSIEVKNKSKVILVRITAWFKV